jgi:hypothetical protein
MCLEYPVPNRRVNLSRLIQLLQAHGCFQAPLYRAHPSEVFVQAPLITHAALACILIYADARHVYLYRPDGQDRHQGSGESLEIPELLPGFKLLIDELFAQA